MNIEHADGHTDTQWDGDHREQKVFPQQRDGERRRGDDFGQQEEEHSERHEDGAAQCNFLTRVRWQVEDEYSQKGDAHAWDDQIHRVEQRFPPHRQIESNVWEWNRRYQ